MQLPFFFLELPVHFLRVSELTIHRRCTHQLVADLHHDQSLLICPHITGNFQKELFSEKDRRYCMIVLVKATANIKYENPKSPVQQETPQRGTIIAP